MKIRAILMCLALGACSNQNFQTQNAASDYRAKGFYQTEVDVLWVIDNSYTTMETHQNRIASKMEQFYKGLLANQADFRIAATTMDMSSQGEKGSLVENGLIVNAQTPSPYQNLQRLLKRGGGGANAELGLDALKAALDLENNPYTSKGFLRKEALLVVVFLTDDEDFSVNQVSYFKNYLDNLKGENTPDHQKWIVNFIGINDLNDPTCTTYGDYSRRGDRYIELAQESGGVVESICKTDFSSFVDQVNIRLKSVMNRYKLDSYPILDSISVKKNGQSVREDHENGWSYDESENVIVLHGESKPSPEDRIEVDYEIKRLK